MDSKIIQTEDKRFFVHKPDSSFSPRRNKAIIQETIQETEKFFKELNDKLDSGLEDRIDILSSYARYRFNQGTKDFENYAGKRLFSNLIGERILSKIRVLDSVQRLNRAKGNTKFSNFILN